MKMKNIFKTIMAGGMAVVMFASCDMDLKPTNAIEYDETKPLFIAQENVDQFMYGVLNAYRALHYGTYSQTPEVMCDGFNATKGYGNNYGPVHRTDKSFTSSDGYTETMWAGHYSSIKDYNVVINAADHKDIPEAIRPSVRMLKGIALFCRASSYLTLARYYGNPYGPDADTDLCVPLITEYDLNHKPHRATVFDIYEQIYLDLEAAKEIFEDTETFGTTFAGQIRAMMPTIDALNALYARYYLDKKEYENATDYANKVIGSEAGYTLSSDITAMDLEFNQDRGTEPIIQFYADMSEGIAGNTIYTNVTQDNVGVYFGSYFIPSQKLLDAYDPTDLRRQAWFSNRHYPLFVDGTRHEGVTIFTKYIGNPNLTTSKIETGAHAVKAIMISEMYLIAAEGYAMRDLTGDAKRILNQLQTARKAALSDGSMESVKKEWFRETVGEGHRFICLKRWGDGFERRDAQAGFADLVMSEPDDAFVGKTIEPGSYLFCWPIPAYEIKLNDNLKEEQNPEYGVE